MLQIDGDGDGGTAVYRVLRRKDNFNFWLARLIFAQSRIGSGSGSSGRSSGVCLIANSVWLQSLGRWQPGTRADWLTVTLTSD
jgi:hypothetical protein